MEKTGGKSHSPRFVRWAHMLGIVIILNLFFMVIRGIVFPTPQYSDYCAANPAVPVIAPASQAVANAQANEAELAMQQCQNSFTAVQKNYESKSFVLLIVLGLLSLIVGMFPLGSSIVSTGLSYGGVLTFILASIQYWNDASQLIQLVISVIALAALIYIGLKRFRD